MSMSVEELEAAALRLTSKERARLAERLLTSLNDEADDPDEVEREWEVEIVRRVAAIDAGTMPLVSGEEAIARARELVRQQACGLDGDASRAARHERTSKMESEPQIAQEKPRQSLVSRRVQRVADAIDNRAADRRLRAPRNRTPIPWDQVKDRLGL